MCIPSSVFFPPVLQQSERLHGIHLPPGRRAGHDGNGAHLRRDDDAGASFQLHKYAQRLYLELLRHHSRGHHHVRHVLRREQPQAEVSWSGDAHLRAWEPALHIAALSDWLLPASLGQYEHSILFLTFQLRLKAET